MRYRSALVLVAVLCLFIGSLSAQTRRRVAVATDAKVPADRLTTSVKLENALLEKLANNSSIEVIDRAHLQSLFSEQNMAYSGQIDPSDTAKIGKLKGVDILVIVNISDLDISATEDATNAVLWLQVTDKGIVHLTAEAQAITVERGQVLTAPTSTIDPPVAILHKAKATVDPQHPYTPKTPAEVASQNQAVLSQIVSKAVNDAASEIYTKMIPALTTAPMPVVAAAPAAPAIAAQVAGMLQGSVLVNQGAKSGYKAGDKFTIVRMADTGIMDPQTRTTIKRKKKICILTLSDVDDDSSTGSCVGDTPKAGDQLTPDAVK